MAKRADGIYVQIPAYRDSELSRTLLDLYRKADAPERLRTGVVWQHADGEELDPAARELPNLDIVDVRADDARGCNWARRIAQQRWAEREPYTLLLDSHHRFVRGWDTLLVRMHERLRKRGSPKPLITSYLPSYDPYREPGARLKRPYRIFPKARDEGLLTQLTSYPIREWTRVDGPVTADYVSLHFIFAAGTFNAELPFDPEIYFFGDEVATGLRAFTSGYDLFHPHVIVGWHCYDRASRVPHWDDHEEWHDDQARSLEHLRRLFLGLEPEAALLGAERTIADYEDWIMAPLVVDP